MRCDSERREDSQGDENWCCNNNETVTYTSNDHNLNTDNEDNTKNSDVYGLQYM